MGYAWLTNVVPVGKRTAARVVVICLMAALMVAALSVLGAFRESAVVFGLALLIMTLLHSALFAISTRAEKPDVSGAILRLAPG